MAHLPRDLDDLVKRDGLGVLDVLLLLAISWWLLEGFDDERAGGWDDADGCLSILDCEADCYSEAFLHSALAAGIYRWTWRSDTHPVTGRLGDIFTDFLRTQTEWTDLGRKSR